MDLPIKSNKKSLLGFSLVEMIIVVGIIALITTISVSVYGDFKKHENTKIVIGGIVEAVRHAQANAQSGKEDSNWGVKLFTNEIVIFEGATYVGRDSSSDQVLTFSNEVSISGLSEIVFTKIIGSTTNTGVIVITNGYETNNISINEKGTITY